MNPSAHRIALISSSYDPYPGGVEEHTRHVARGLRERGHEVVVWTVDRGEHLGTRVIDGVEVRYLPTPLPAWKPLSVLNFLRRCPRAWRAWMSAYRAFRPDVLHVQCFGPNGVYALALHHRTSAPIVVSSHGETSGDENGVFAASRLLRAALKGSIREAHAVTACSTMVLDDLRDAYGLTTGLVVPNGVDLQEAHRLGLDADEFPAPDEATVFAVGRAVSVKGFDLLIRAFARTKADSARLVIGGDGPELDGLKLLASEQGLDERVFFPGRMGRAEVIQAMATAAVVVVPSRAEAFGIVVLEAWRGGAALVATTRGGPRDFVADGINGLLVDPEDTQAFATVLDRLLVDADLRERLGLAGRAEVQSYTWERTVAAYETIFSELPAH